MQTAKKSASYLCTVMQKADESFRGYVARFHKACLEIPNLNEGVAIKTIKQGIYPDEAFFNSMLKVKSITLDQIQEKTQKYIR